MKKALLLISVVAGALLLAACSSSDSDSNSDPNESDTTLQTTTTVQAPVSVDVSIKDLAFAPDTVTLKVGDTVRWTNNDGGIGHTTTSEEGVWKSDLLGAGNQFEYTFTEAGEFAYFCSIHTSMKGTVSVQG